MASCRVPLRIGAGPPANWMLSITQPRASRASTTLSVHLAGDCSLASLKISSTAQLASRSCASHWTMRKVEAPLGLVVKRSPCTSAGSGSSSARDAAWVTRASSATETSLRRSNSGTDRKRRKVISSLSVSAPLGRVEAWVW
ncbi:hypothetical protein Hsero_3628 [Herbaspirillum seropedicae SmR1]|uniref:Uncharacterized protein n=1 Tax=Herbaspirillum seropedicae (strain SmR1) TaxID=757424 RepID=D8IQJ4_HERSS|nr:hypothetical protein Hsero_3628 [Herbaspirillum seropedicae SmR1]